MCKWPSVPTETILKVEAQREIEWLELWGILSYFGRELERRSEAVLQEAGLSHVQFRLLYSLMLSAGRFH